ncbi:MAG TPA: glycerophosphodiester phosphodiesterase [Polyangia bacterium]
MGHDALAERWRRGERGRPLILGHRGASAREVENTLPAFAQAEAEGADGVELDVFLCASGEIVVFHDDDLQRLAGMPQRVRELSLRELRAVTLLRGGRIPTLAEVFEACGPELLVNVEIKSLGMGDRSLPALVAGVSDVIDHCAAASRVLISSFDPQVVLLWQQLRADVPAALVFEDGIGPALGKALTLPFLRPKAVHPEAVLCRPDLVAAWHAAGYLVNTWTVDEPNRLRDLSRVGVDGIITNDPAGALLALA